MALPTLPRWPRLAQWLLLLSGGAFFALGLEWLQVPAALLVGPLIWGAILGMRGATVRMGRIPYLFGQGIAGVLIAHNLDPEVLGQTVAMWPVVLLFVVLTLVLACGVGLAAARLTGLDPEVTVWGFLPGMAGTMIALAHDRGIDSRMVAFLQILRLLMVIGAMVAAGAVLVGAGAQPDHAGPGPTTGSTLVALVLAGLGIVTARLMPVIPGGASLVPLIVGGALWINGVNITLPHGLIALAYLFLGLQVGLRFTPDLVRKGARALPMLLLAGGLLLVLCAMSGAVLAWVAGVDLMSAMLATVPGSIDSIALIALSTGSDMSFVMTLQTVRLFAVVLLGPTVARGALILVQRRPMAGRG